MSHVVVEIAPPASSPELAQALIDACSAAVRTGDCVLGSDETPNDTAAVAIVRWDDSEQGVRIELGAQSSLKTDWHTRHIEFGAEDERAERWRTVGLTIATLAGEAMPEAAPPSATSKPTLPAAQQLPRPRAQGTPLAQPRALWVGLAAMTGPGLDDGSFRFGAWADVGWRPSLVPIFARFSAGFAERPTGAQHLSVGWETVTLGFGAVLGTGPLLLEPRASASVDVVRASATDPDSRREDSKSRVTSGIHAGADIVYRIGRIGIVAGVDVFRLHDATDILVQNESEGASPAGGWSVALGARFFLE